MCSVMVPEMVRTAPEPAPYFRAASMAASQQLGMSGQAEIVVGGEVDDLLAVEARFGGARRFEDAQALVDAFGFPLVELIVQVGERIHVRSSPAAWLLTFLTDLNI